MKKENVRLLFNKDKDLFLSDFIVVEFNKKQPSEWPNYLYDRYPKDFGNCDSDWDEWSLAYILNYFMIGCKITDEMKLHVMLELLNIDEYRDEIKKMIRTIDIYYPIRGQELE